MPSVSVSSIVTNASNTADITAAGTYFNSTLLGIAFVVTVAIMVIKIAYTWIIKRGVRGAVKAIGVGGGRRGRGRRR